MSEPAPQPAPPAPVLPAPPPAVVGLPDGGAAPSGVSSSENFGLPEQQARRIDLYWSGGMVAAMAFLFFALSLVRGVAVPVVMALIIAYALNPIVSFVESKGLRRRWGALLCFALGLLVFVG